MALEKYWVLLYNPHQNQFHAETVEVMLEQNHLIFAKGTLTPDWYVLAFGATDKEIMTARRRFMKLNPRAGQLPGFPKL